jgi:hypothetical protein
MDTSELMAERILELNNTDSFGMHCNAFVGDVLRAGQVYPHVPRDVGQPHSFFMGLRDLLNGSIPKYTWNSVTPPEFKGYYKAPDWLYGPELGPADRRYYGWPSWDIAVEFFKRLID